jgi:hypothetical protein
VPCYRTPLRQTFSASCEAVPFESCLCNEFQRPDPQLIAALASSKICAIFVADTAMHIQSESPTELVVVDGTLWMAVPFAMIAAFTLYLTIAHAALHTGSRWDFIVPLMFGLFAWATAQRTRVVFNAMQRTVTWQRFQYLRISSGSCSFSEVTDAAIEAGTSDKGGRVHRLALITAQGRVPMSNGYSGIGNIENLRGRILEFVMGAGAAAANKATKPGEFMESVRALVAQRQKIEAIKVLRENTSYGLAQAKSVVDSMEAEIKAGR